MSDVSVLQEMYQKQQIPFSVQSPEQKQCKVWTGMKRFFFIGLFVGTLTSTIPLITFALLLARPSNSYGTLTKTAQPSLRWKSEAITVAGISSSPGLTDRQLNYSTDIKLDYLGSMYIVDKSNNRIQKYFKDTTTGVTVAGLSNGTITSTSYGLKNPSRILLDSNQNFYIVDTENHRVQFWKNGTSSGQTVAGTSGSPGASNNQLTNPYGAAYDPATNTLYVADYGRHRVMSYSSGATSGILVASGNGTGSNNTKLNYPVGIHFDSFTNSLFIVNHYWHNVVQWKLGDDHWTPLAGSAQGNSGNSATFLRFPTYITVDPMGNLYVADRNNYRIQIFLNGEFIGKTIAGISSVLGSNSTLLNLPWSIELDSQLNLYVADAANHRIQKFLRY